ncbi:MAG: cytochrome P450 [Pseudomonadota bacterium]
MSSTVAEFIQMEPPQPGESDHAYLKRYRDAAPVAMSMIGVPIVFHHRNIAKLIDPKTTRQLETEMLLLLGVTDGPIFDFYSTTMLFSNGDVHKRRRGQVAKTFAFKVVEEVRSAVRDMSEAIVTESLNKGRIDFLGDFAGAIPARVIGHMLGVPEKDTAMFRRLVYSAVRGVGAYNPDDRPEIERDMTALNEYGAGLLAERLENPVGDFLSHYGSSATESEVLSLEEIRAQIFTLIGAGTDTTRLAICSGLSQLLQYPDQWGAFCEDPEGLKKDVALEALRYDPSVASFPRVVTAEIDIDGYAIAAGTPIGVSTMSAMRDPEVYAEPDRFNIFREDHPRWHPVFGAGAHRCLGEALAKIEMEETLAAIARLAPRTAMVGPPPSIQGLRGVRQIDRMDVEFRS